MERVISATQARIHFGELLRQVAETREPVIVERDGRPQVAVIAIEEYERLKAQSTQDNWQLTLENIHRLAAEIMERRGGVPLPPADELIRQGREERDEQLMAAIGLR